MSKESTTTHAHGITTAGVATFSEGEGSPAALFRVMPDIPIDYALEQASVMMGCVHKLTFVGVMDKDDTLVWAAHLLSGMAHALVEDLALGVSYHIDDKAARRSAGTARASEGADAVSALKA